eukprot:jgi/Hompol1/365/HPOL_005295-RA
MSKGKVAAQCCHAALDAFKHAAKTEQTLAWRKRWERGSNAKVTLKCPDEQTMYVAILTLR